MAKNDGGPALPHEEKWVDQNRFEQSRTQPGMSLRDWFAGQYLAGLASDPSYDNTSFAAIADEAYLAADAMVAKREKPNG